MVRGPGARRRVSRSSVRVGGGWRRARGSDVVQRRQEVVIDGGGAPAQDAAARPCAPDVRRRQTSRPVSISRTLPLPKLMASDVRLLTPDSTTATTKRRQHLHRRASQSVVCLLRGNVTLIRRRFVGLLSVQQKA